MMLRVLFLVVLAALTARASDKIDAPSEGASKSVQQPHVVAELIPEMTTVEAGKPFRMILHLKMDPGWHTYWINPGDAGLATTIKWTLPPGFTAGPILWPTPENHSMGPLVTYGYEGDVYLLTEITPPATGDLPEHLDVTAKASWLVCQEECIPGKAELTVQLDSGLLNFRLPMENKELFKEARERLPATNMMWTVTAMYAKSPAFPGTPNTKEGILINFKPSEKMANTIPPNLRFYPEQANVLSTIEADNLQPVPYNDSFTIPIGLQQNGDKPSHLSGVLVSSEKFASQMVIGRESIERGTLVNAVYIEDFQVFAERSSGSGAGPAPATSGNAAPPSGANATEPAGQRPAATGAGGADSGVAGAGPAPVDANASSSATPSTSANASEPGAGPAPATSSQADAGGAAAQRAAATAASQPLLIAVLGAAFVGGLILNLMPCVLPVLSLKVFALIKHAGDHPGQAWKQGVAFAAGVVVSFWILAGLLLALRAAGNQLGWGFQMQSPGFVAGLIVLFFLIGLNLFGVFEIGGSLVGVDAKAASQAGGSVSSFLNGALATVAATPCTAPFMGSALGFAAQQPAFVSMLIFTFLALGMAAPYLFLTIFPQSLRFVPKPGAWMESLKQFMGFLLMGTVIFLVYVFAELTGYDQIPEMLGVLLLLSLAAWIYGRWGGPEKATAVRVMSIAVCLLIVIAAVSGAAVLTSDVDDHAMANAQRTMAESGWQTWSPEAVQAALAKGQPVFVDFTAAWCLSCKVNERVALGTDAVKKAFADKNVALFRADWTHADPVISQTLQKFNRDGVPLYLLYSPKAPDAPQVLPEVLTPGIVLDALGKI